MKTSVLALLFMFSGQLFASGDQSGLLNTLYNTKADYVMYLNKGASENGTLTKALSDMHAGLVPYVGRSIDLNSSYSAPIRQTVNLFQSEFAVEDQALAATFTNIEATVSRLQGQQKSTCAAVSYRYSVAKGEMMRIWNARVVDSKTLLDKMTAIANEADRPGLVLITPELLNSMLSTVERSNADRATYVAALRAVDARLVSIIEDIRVCFNID